MASNLSPAHVQGGAPHLLEYLRDKYVEVLNERISLLHQQGKKTSFSSGDAVVRSGVFRDFYAFACEFLAEHRVVENFFVDANHGLVLSNNDRVVICPSVDIAGTMQDSGAIAVTQGRSQQGNEGVITSDSLSIR